MRLQSTPNRVVNKWIRRGGKRKIKTWFKFDDKGFVTIDESKVSITDLQKLKKAFKVVDGIESPKPIKENPMATVNGKQSINGLSYKELQVLYSDTFHESAVGKKKADLIKELEV